MAAQAIPRASWSEGEEQRARLFYWHYLVNTWLSPEPSVLSEPDEPSSGDRWVGPTAENRLANGWLLETETISEQ
jgi:hypothetical protein